MHGGEVVVEVEIDVERRDALKNAEFSKVFGRTDAGEHKKLGHAQRAAADDGSSTPTA